MAQSGHIWVCGYVGMWVCGYAGRWVCGYVGGRGLSFGLFALLTSSRGGKCAHLGRMKVPGLHHDGNILDFSMAQKRAEMVTLGAFSDLNHLLNGCKTSNLVRSGQDTFPDGVEGLIYDHGP